MMKNLSFVLLLAVVALFSACSPSRDKTVQKITAVEKQLFAPDAYSFSKPKADSLVAMYEAFAADFPTDTLVPEYIFKAGSISMNAGEPGKAIAFFDTYMQKYPDESRAAMCMFFKAFINENSLGNLDKAREIYLNFIEKYPDDEFTDDAKLALMNLGKSPEMMVKEFEAKAKADSAI